MFNIRIFYYLFEVKEKLCWVDIYHSRIQTMHDKNRGEMAEKLEKHIKQKWLAGNSGYRRYILLSKDDVLATIKLFLFARP